MINKIKYLIGDENYCTRPFQPFSDLVCNFLESFSNELNSKNVFKDYPELKSLSFWCRKKNILNLKEKFFLKKNRLGLGLLLHIAPSNVPINFVYSLIFGLLTGNSNIVKVPSKNFMQISIICEIIKKILKQKKNILKKKITIVQYSNNDDYTKKISSECNARVIWGGDKTINSIRQFRINEKTLDVTFPDRYSFCILSSTSINKLNKFDLKILINKFYNDTYYVDQNACSSPHLILWTGKNKTKAKKIFWEALFEYLKKNYKLKDSATIEKYTTLCDHTTKIKEIKNISNYENLIYKIELKKIDKRIDEFRGKWGLFFEHDLKNLNDIKNIVNTKYQTLTYFGLDKKLLYNIVIQNGLKGINRIVPIGNSLNIGLDWDGYDIVNILTRGIELQ
jgi:hypothetical protein